MWEYRIEILSQDGTLEGKRAQLNVVGELNWELVSAVQGFIANEAPRVTTPGGVICFFKRPKA